jgi:arsenate reductase
MKLLFICTHNRCRSILAEAITNHLGNGRLQARSAGSQPAGEVHPLTLKYLVEAGISTANLSSQSWDELENFEPDVVITVCDSAAGEQCPVWFGKSVKVHWGLPDPSRVTGNEAEVKAAFSSVMHTLEKRIKALLELPTDNLDKEQIIATFNALGKQ